jgi:hypothetical protein
MDTARLPENVPIPTHTNSFVIFVVPNDVVDRLKQHGDPWRLSEDLPPPGKGHSTQ